VKKQFDNVVLLKVFFVMCRSLAGGWSGVRFFVYTPSIYRFNWWLTCIAVRLLRGLGLFQFLSVLFDLAHLTQVDVDEVYRGETRKHNFKREYGGVLLHRHEVPMLKDVGEN
jgi:hypothetical protein